MIVVMITIKTRWVMEGGEGMMMMGAVLVHTGTR